MIYLPNQDYYGDKNIQECELLQSIVRFITNSKFDYDTRLEYGLLTLQAAVILWKR